DWNAYHRRQEAEESAELARQHLKFAGTREPVLHDIDMSLQAILDLKTRLNTLTAIGRLPDELLAEILITLMRENYDSVRREYCSGPPQPRWIILTHICRHWRRVALDTAQLWSLIYLTRADIFSAFLERSKAALLSIDVHYEYYSDDTSSLSLIPPVSSRIRHLSVYTDVSKLQTFCKQLTQPLERLEQLVLSSRQSLSFSYDRASSSFPVIPRAGLTPLLRHLELHRVPFRWDDPIFCSTLTTLRVTATVDQGSHRSDRPNVGSTEDLLDVLMQIAPHLEVLDLDETLPTYHRNPGSPPPSRLVSFPSLRSLHLRGPTYACGNLLSHFSMNQAASVHLDGQGSRGMEDVIRCLAAHLSAKPIVAMRLGKSVSLDVNIFGWHTPDMSDNAPICLSFYKLYGLGEEDAMHIFIREIGALLSHVVDMKVVGGAIYKVKWGDLFALTPQVCTLAFNGHPFDLFEALLDVRTLPSGQCLVPLPELRTVSFDDILFRYPKDNMDQEFIDDMVTWVKLRQRVGTPIQSLELSACQYSKEADIQQLRKIVPNVVWDEWEKESSEEEDSGDGSSDDTYFGHRYRFGLLDGGIEDDSDNDEDEDVYSD
ncbi:hypothetical protein V8D89_001864, partial [Ganoderma adspersum]